MPPQSRRPASRPTRSQRRAGATGVRTYNVAERAATTYVPRRNFAAEPPPVDYATEYRWIRKDLFRIFLWSGLLILAMVALSFVF